MKLNVKTICENAVVAAIYIVLTIVTTSFSYMGIQFRIAEMLILLCFFRKDYVFGLSIGCFIANIVGPLGWVDAVFGTLATIISCLGIMFSKWLLPVILVPVVVNAFVVGAELYFVYQYDFWLNVGLVAAGEVTVIVAAYIICLLLKKRKYFYRVIDANQNMEFKF